MFKILVCDDEKEIVEAIEIYLIQEGYEVLKAYDGMEALDILRKEEVNLLIIDVMMPKLNGIRATLKIRESNSIPIIILSAKSEDADKILGLNIGADDYLTKPFGMMEMVSRIRAVLRRSRPKEEIRILRIGSLELNLEGHTVSVGGSRVLLTLKEFEILRLLMDNPGRVFTREQLLQSVWGASYMGETRTIDVHIGTLRAKLGCCGDYIETVRGVGYRMEG